MWRRDVILVLSCMLGFATGLICWECENVNSQKECLRKGKAKKCQRNENMCHFESRMGGWGQAQWIRKTCKSFQACLDNHLQNLRPAWAFKGPQIQCNRYSPSSVCRCCCSKHLCNHRKTSCFPNEFDRPMYCPALRQPSKGTMKCSRKRIIGSMCVFTCKPGFVRVGNPVLVCGILGKWNHPKPPQCMAVTCSPIPRNPRRGSVTCTNGMQLGSRCSFSCEKGYRLSGSSETQCIDDMNKDEFGVWSAVAPKCIPRQCPANRPFQNGVIRCSNKNFVDSVCHFQCDTVNGYRIYPQNAPTAVLCERNEEWDNPRPCCSLPCPPYAAMDLIFLLGSSSSIGPTNWIKMKQFVSGFIKNFVISSNATQVGAIKYNLAVDRIQQILLNEFPDSLEDIEEAIDDIPYTGSDTNIGKALNYTVDVLLKRGNRKNAKDVVILFTDEESHDNVTIAAKRLRATGALIYVIPVKTQSGNINMKQLLNIVGPGNQENILAGGIDEGFDALDKEFAATLIRNICVDPCNI